MASWRAPKGWTNAPSLLEPADTLAGACGLAAAGSAVVFRAAAPPVVAAVTSAPGVAARGGGDDDHVFGRVGSDHAVCGSDERDQ